MKVDRRELESNLPKKGFRREDSGDHIYFYFEKDGRLTSAYTKVSHTKKLKVISGGLLTAVRRQLHLETNQDVIDLVSCPMSEAEYLERLIAQGVIMREETSK